jgi:hypothetical protein
MAIQSAGEFDVVLSDIVFRLDRVLHEQPRNGALTSARRQMQLLREWVKKGQKIAAREMSAVTSAVETIRMAEKNDSELEDRLYDLMDYVEQNHKA